jgi:hypothetical protein
MRTFTSLTLGALLCVPGGSPAAEPGGFRQVVIDNGNVAEVAGRKTDAAQLWVTPADLTRATKLVLKPEGVCDEDRCFSIPPERKAEFLKEDNGKTWFNLGEFAHLLKQPVARDAKQRVWYLGPRPDVRNGYLATLIAPDFTLPDMQGKNHSLADFRGKKVLLLTWASW